MFRAFLRDRRGNYAMMMIAAMIPMMGGLALAVDYGEMSRQRQVILNALDAAGVATARRFVEGATDEELIAYANDFFRANVGGIDPDKARLDVVLPNTDAGGGRVKLSARMTYHPYFLPTFQFLIGKNGTSEYDFQAQTEVQLKNTLEVALVLDNSGSMDDKGSGSGKKRIDLLKDAAKQLVDTMSAQAANLKQVAEPVRFGLVPFAASVNVGPANSGAAWMDQDGISPVHHENFDWTTMSSGNKRVELSGGVYYKKGAGWGAQENQKVTRFTIFNDLQRQTGTQKVKTGTKEECNSKGKNCKTVEVFEDQPVYGSYASWAGCVETRPHPYDKDDTAPATGKPATLFVPMFAPDETDLKDSSNRSAMGNWWADGTSDSSNRNRGRYMPKYFTPAGTGKALPGADEGPNASCTTTAITPLRDVTKTEGKTAIKAAIDAMSPLGGTNVSEGLAWGWRVLSSGAPFTEGRNDSEKGNDKVVIVLTDGANTYYTPGSLSKNDLADNRSIYSNYGYTRQTQSGGSTTRLFMGTSVSKTTYTNDNYTAAMNEQMATLCSNAKDKNIIVMTVALDLSTKDSAQKKQIEGLKACSSDSRFRRDASDASKAAKLFWNTTGGDLAKTFKEIADELSNLRIVG
jgi:Flp pilus assembly protein TadG